MKHEKRVALYPNGTRTWMMRHLCNDNYSRMRAQAAYRLVELGEMANTSIDLGLAILEQDQAKRVVAGIGPNDPWPGEEEDG